MDDVIFSQPVNVLMRLARGAQWLLPGRPAGVSVVIVNYNSIDLIQDVVRAVRHFSPPDTEIIVVDNASTDGSWSWLKRHPEGIRTLRTFTNIGHGRALDLGVYMARSPIVVTLDSDAFPYSRDWLPALLSPLADTRMVAAGSWGPRGRLHPACAAFKRRELLALGLSFHNFNLHKDVGEAPVFGVNTWDTGELISEALGPDRVTILPTGPSGRGWGTVMDGVVYHHTGMTTGLSDDPGQLLARKKELWQRAVSELLPDLARDSSQT